MSSAREIIAKTIKERPPSSSAAVANWIVYQLEAAGYRILGPDEVDPVTLEQALVAVNEIEQRRGYSAAYRGGASDCDAAIRTLVVKT